MRGKVFRYPVREALRGITPAHAGKSTLSKRVDAHNQDHPRPCGEKYSRFSPILMPSGSPPPMRGKVLLRLNPIRLLRITPAHAGKSTLTQKKEAKAKDHPRPCGEKHMTPALKATAKGSPPPMRGKVRYGAGKRARAGITPAHAGKSFFCCVGINSH